MHRDSARFVPGGQPPTMRLSSTRDASAVPAVRAKTMSYAMRAGLATFRGRIGVVILPRGRIIQCIIGFSWTA
jgi:hypothetical protein